MTPTKDSSLITVRVNQRSANEIGAQADCMRPRTTELAAFQQLTVVPRLSPLHRKVFRLECIAMNPSLYRRVRNRPPRPLFGMEKLLWIAARLGTWRDGDERRVFSARDVMELLEEVDRIGRIEAT